MTLNHKNPLLNRVHDRDQAAHGWYRFVLSFPPHLVQKYLHKFGITREQWVLDPFCGTGTTVVESKKLGIPAVGVERNPMAHFAASVKLDWTPDPQVLWSLAQEIGDQVQDQTQHCDPSWLGQDPSSLRKLSSTKDKLLLKNSISPLPLHKTLVLLDRLNQHQSEPGYRHLQLALAKALVSGISNLHFGPEVGVREPKVDAPVVDLWLKQVETIAADLNELKPLRENLAHIYQADAREIQQVLEPNSIDAVITSPPYPNEKDYTRTTRLESVLLGFIDDRTDLRAVKQDLLRSNTRNVYKADQDDLWAANYPKIQHIAQTIEERRRELGKTSGFERLYPRTVQLYFGGMARHLAELRSILRPGAHLAYVVGDQKSYLQVMICTGQLLGEIAEDLGYELVTIDLFRTRIATATKEQMREEVVILKWPGSL